MMVLGLGAGGCGLASLAHLLTFQRGSTVTKEYGIRYTSWAGSIFSELSHAEDWQKQLQSGGVKLAGDVAFYHLPYAYEIARRHDNCRVIWMGREPEKMVECLIRGAADTHPWLEHVGGTWNWNPLNISFPSFGVPDIRQAAGLYVDFYTRAARLVMSRLASQMRYFHTDCLNSVEGQLKILEWLEVEKPVTFPGGIDVNPR